MKIMKAREGKWTPSTIHYISETQLTLLKDKREGGREVGGRCEGTFRQLPTLSITTPNVR